MQVSLHFWQFCMPGKIEEHKEKNDVLHGSRECKTKTPSQRVSGKMKGAASLLSTHKS